MPEKILLIDDEANLRGFVARVLEDHGYECFQAGSADEAEDVLQAGDIDLCFLDISMPDKPGDVFLKKLKRIYPEVAVIMLTGISTPEMANKCRDLGADDYLVKPIEAESLLITLNNVQDRRRLLQENMIYHTQMEKKLVEQAEKLQASQSMLIQQEKLAAIGQLAAGVAHEINNPLGFITSNLNTLMKYAAKFKDYRESVNDLCKTLQPESQQQFNDLNNKLKFDALLEDLPELIDESIDGAKRIKTIVQSLKSFSRPDADEAVPVNVNECLENAITVVWNEIKYNSKLERDFAELQPVRGYPQQLAQVFMNLLVNASHAITAEGLITIRTSASNGMVTVTISDNGCGIAPENLNKIFDPFFSTKPPGKGTGLGMSIVSNIVQKHGGRIYVASEVGQGTTFTTQLPLDRTDE